MPTTLRLGAAAAAILTQVVVLPTPPLFDVVRMVRVCTGASLGAVDMVASCGCHHGTPLLVNAR